MPKNGIQAMYLDCVTRWTSLEKMISSNIELKSVIQKNFIDLKMDFGFSRNGLDALKSNL